MHLRFSTGIIGALKFVHVLQCLAEGTSCCQQANFLSVYNVRYVFFPTWNNKHKSYYFIRIKGQDEVSILSCRISALLEKCTICVLGCRLCSTGGMKLKSSATRRLMIISSVNLRTSDLDILLSAKASILRVRRVIRIRNLSFLGS